MKSGQLAHSQFCALCAVYAGVPSCWKMNTISSRSGDCFKRMAINNNL